MVKRNVKLPELECSDIEILRYLIKVFYERENDELVWRLIERFGSVPNIFGAAYEELVRVDGVTDRVATFFVFMRPLYRQALLRSEPNIKVVSEASLVRYALVYFMNERNPFDVCVYLNKKGRLIKAVRLIEEDRTREIICGISRYGADKLAWMRFYPHEAERSDMQTVARLELIHKLLPAFKALETEFIDYIEYAPFKFFDLRRAVDGNELMSDLKDADGSPYSRFENISARIRGYIDMCVERFEQEKGDER